MEEPLQMHSIYLDKLSRLQLYRKTAEALLLPALLWVAEDLTADCLKKLKFKEQLLGVLFVAEQIKEMLTVAKTVLLLLSQCCLALCF